MTDSLSSEERQQLTLLFDRAADLPATERASFVERECGANAALRDELARLLGTLDGDDVVERLKSGSAISSGMRTGTDVGPYRLLERIGMGGMGEVYAASQTEPVRRRVALKVIKPGMDSAQVVMRFDAERQALARMSHPHVAQIFDGGVTSDGRPYFVMEHVAGDPITDYCDRHKLATRERLELFLSVCAGVQHAHQKGLIHRDLKPSNLLVTVQDGQAIPKIIDFGIARATTGSLSERTLHTMVGQVMGTLEYMSPEQADPTALDIDTRSDVYSLGVVLYELVSGLLPFDHASADRPLAEIQHAIRELDPPTPSTRHKDQTDGTTIAIALQHGTDPLTLARQLAGDLDWICLKALEKDPARRYASPSELADDVRRHLSDEPVLAGKPGVLYRARKYVRRNRLGVTAAVLVAGAGLAGIFGIVSGRIAAEKSAEEADRNAKEAQANLVLAQESEAEAQAERDRAEAETAKVLRLSDVKLLQELLAEADVLWPAYPEKIADLDSWMDRARSLASNLPGHRSTLAEMRSGALPWTNEQRARDLESHPRAAELREKQSEVDGLLAQLDGGLAGEQNVTAEERLAELEPQIQELTDEVESRRTWRFDAPQTQWQHDVLVELVEGLERLESEQLSEDAIVREHGWSVGKRLDFARELGRGFAEGGEYTGVWADALPSIKDKYPGLDLMPQMGLLPIGPDPDSGLWEFAHLMTGVPPAQDAEGRLVLTEEMGVVLVLIPGGSFWMGAKSSDPSGRNDDPKAGPDESPVHEVELSAYFLSKYELTQGQWKRLTGTNPSNYGPDRRWDSQWLASGAETSLLHPVEHVSWEDCRGWLPRAGLSLPSEAQWECGARANTQTVYWSGSDLASLEGVANLSDAYGKSHGNARWSVWEPELDDGSTVHWPAGTSRANAFGLHDVHGNLWEWCLDGYDSGFYGRSPRLDPVAPWQGAAYRVVRGGSFRAVAQDARSAHRRNGLPSDVGALLGVRPARVISE